jgi:uncharacterized membrane protein YqjE
MAVDVRDGNPRPIGEVVRDLAQGTQTLIMQEIELAKLELKESAMGATRAAIFLGGAAAFGIVGLIMASITVTALLALMLPVWLSALIVTFGLLAVAGGLGLIGRSMLAKTKPIPEQTVQSLKEDQEWLKRQMS